MRLRHAPLYTISIYINTILAALQGIVAATLLDPYYMGYFSQIKVILAYLMMINVGFINGLLIVLPKSDRQTQQEYINAGFWMSLALYSLGAFVFLILYFIMHEKSFLFVAIVFPIYGIKEIPIYIMRGKGDFKSLSIMYIISSIVSFALITGLIYYFKFIGALGALSLTVILMLVLGLGVGKIRVSLKIKKQRIVGLFRNGIFIYIKDFFRFLKSSMEKLIMMFIMPKEVYAVYTVGIVMISFFDILPSTIFQYLLPDFIREGTKWSEERMSKTISIITYIMTVLLLGGIYVFSMLIPKILPAYTSSLIIFYLLTFTCYINIWNYIIYNKFVSENKIKYMYASQFIGLFALLVSIAVFYGLMNVNVSDMIFAAYSILIARTAYIISLIIIFRASTSLNLFTPETSIISGSSILTIIAALLLVSRNIHIIPLLLFAYSIIYFKRLRAWIRELTL